MTFRYLDIQITVMAREGSFLVGGSFTFRLAIVVLSFVLRAGGAESGGVQGVLIYDQENVGDALAIPLEFTRVETFGVTVTVNTVDGKERRLMGGG